MRNSNGLFYISGSKAMSYIDRDKLSLAEVFFEELAGAMLCHISRRASKCFTRSYYIEKLDNTNTENIRQDDGDTIRELQDIREPASLAPTLP
jgi:hypothetical protein